jgi:predicted cobalt transporter CbtA
MLSFRAVLKSALIAGIVAGLCVAAFHLLLTEPVLDRAIRLEEQQARSAGTHDAQAEDTPLVSRPMQKAGLFLGYLIYGLSWALFFSVAYHLLQGRLAARGVRWGAAALAFLLYWSIVLVPFLKYPANPPGVGDPATVADRQNLYLIFLLLSAGSAALAVTLGKYVARLMAGQRRLLTLAWLVLLAAMLLLLMPGNPDPATMPAEIVLPFRAFSLGGLTLFWAIFGLCFGWLARRAANPRPMTAPAV